MAASAKAMLFELIDTAIEHQQKVNQEAGQLMALWWTKLDPAQTTDVLEMKEFDNRNDVHRQAITYLLLKMEAKGYFIHDVQVVKTSLKIAWSFLSSSFAKSLTDHTPWCCSMEKRGWPCWGCRKPAVDVCYGWAACLEHAGKTPSLKFGPCPGTCPVHRECIK
jgi:hypothetical protein